MAKTAITMPPIINPAPGFYPFRAVDPRNEIQESLLVRLDESDLLELNGWRYIAISPIDGFAGYWPDCNTDLQREYYLPS